MKDFTTLRTGSVNKQKSNDKEIYYHYENYSFDYAKQLLERVRRLFTWLQGELVKEHLRFERIDEIIHSYEKAREEADEQCQSICAEAASLANRIGTLGK